MRPTAPPRGEKGTELLLAHCSALVDPEELRGGPFARLEDAVGSELARLLVRALAGGRRRGLVRV